MAPDSGGPEADDVAEVVRADRETLEPLATRLKTESSGGGTLVVLAGGSTEEKTLAAQHLRQLLG